MESCAARPPVGGLEHWCASRQVKACCKREDSRRGRTVEGKAEWGWSQHWSNRVHWVWERYRFSSSSVCFIQSHFLVLILWTGLKSYLSGWDSSRPSQAPGYWVLLPRWSPLPPQDVAQVVLAWLIHQWGIWIGPSTNTGEQGEKLCMV